MTYSKTQPTPSGFIVRGMKNADYHADKESYSSSLIKLMDVPAEARYYMTAPREPKDAWRIGGAVHKWVLERPDFEAEFLLGISCARRSKADKAAWADWFSAHGASGDEITQNNPAAKWNGLFELETGMCMVKPEEIEAIKLMSESIMRNDNAAELLSKGEAESSIFWTDKATGLPLKVRPDYLNNSFTSDLKSCDSVHDHQIQRSIINYGYAISAAMYTDGVRQLTGEWKPFLFLFIEKNPPYACRVIALDDEAQELAFQQYETLKLRLAECLAADTWSGLPDNLSFSLPHWTFNDA